MLRHFIFPCILATILQPVEAQQPTVAPQPVNARQSAMNMLEEVLSATGSLSLPQNRLAIELQAFPVVYSRSDARARALIHQMAGEFAQAAQSSNEDPDTNPTPALARRRELRTNMARNIAASDPELALAFLSATLPYVQSSSANDDPEDHALVVDLAAQLALHNPQRALQLAEQQLKEADDLPPSFITLLEQVERADSQVGLHLFRDAVDHIKQQNLSQNAEQLSFAASLLGYEFSRQSEATGAPDTALRSLADIVATSAINAENYQPFMLGQAWSALDSLVPGKSATLRPKAAVFQSLQPAPNSFQDYTNALSSGDTNKVLTAIAQMPEEDRNRWAQQAAWGFAGNGDLQRTRQITEALEPWQRSNILQNAVRSAAYAAAGKSDFAAARQLAAQITNEDSRATLLGELAIYANATGKHKLAEELLGEAAALVMNHTAGMSAFSAELSIAQDYLRVDPAQAIPLLEHSARQLEQALSAAAQLDGFLPDGHSFEGNELILNQGFLYQSLIQPYANAAAELATIDLQAARTLADRIPLPEARLMTELYVASAALGMKDQTQTAADRFTEGFWQGDRR